MTEVEKIFITNLRKICTNKYRTIDSWDFVDNKPVAKRQWYRHPDLDDFSKEAFDKGEHWFYCKPADSRHPYGKQVLCEPEYEYRINVTLTEEEYQEIMKKLEE